MQLWLANAGRRRNNGAVMSPKTFVSSERSHDDPAEPARRACVARMARGDEAGLAELYDDTAARVYGLALRITGEAAAAEEVTSEVYLQAWQQASRYDAERGKVLTWLLTLARSRALDHLRRSKHHAVRAEPGDVSADSVSDGNDPLDLLLAVERGHRLHQALRALTPVQRQLLALAFFKGLTHAEIAAHTGMALGTVKTSLRRAMQLLKPLLESSTSAEETS